MNHGSLEGDLNGGCEALYLEKLREYFAQRRQQNPRYSLRAFSRDLGLSAGSMSEIFKGKRVLTSKMAERITSQLNLAPRERMKFLMAVAISEQLKALVEVINLGVSFEESSEKLSCDGLAQENGILANDVTLNVALTQTQIAFLMECTEAMRRGQVKIDVVQSSGALAAQDGAKAAYRLSASLMPISGAV